jgi:hypothetical protein
MERLRAERLTREAVKTENPGPSAAKKQKSSKITSGGKLKTSKEIEKR